MKPSNPNRSFWPYGIVCFFALALTFIISFIVWCCHQREDLVANNYYDDEIRYQQEIDRFKRTEPIASQIEVAYDAREHNIVIKVPSLSSQPPVGQIHLYRPADERLDQQLSLTPDDKGIQHLNAKTLAPGLWKVRLEWSVNGQDYLFDRSVVIANPS